MKGLFNGLWWVALALVGGGVVLWQVIENWPESRWVLIAGGVIVIFGPMWEEHNRRQAQNLRTVEAELRAVKAELQRNTAILRALQKHVTGALY